MVRVRGAGNGHSFVVTQCQIATQKHIADVDIVSGVNRYCVSRTEVVRAQQGEQICLRIIGRLARVAIIADGGCVLIIDQSTIVDEIITTSRGN